MPMTLNIPEDYTGVARPNSYWQFSGIILDRMNKRATLTYTGYHNEAAVGVKSQCGYISYSIDDAAQYDALVADIDVQLEQLGLDYAIAAEDQFFAEAVKEV